MKPVKGVKSINSSIRTTLEFLRESLAAADAGKKRPFRKALASLGRKR